MGEDVKRFKLREEKHVMNEVECMTWSPSMDLLAFGNKNGEVIVNRLSWQRVWSLAPPSDGDRVGGLAWRPDGKVIAVGYTSGIIRVCDVEKGDQVYIAAVKGAVSCVLWLEQSKQLSEGKQRYRDDNSATYLPSAKQQSATYKDTSKEQSGLEAHERFRHLTSQKQLNLLIVGSDCSEVSIFSYGAFPTAIVDLSTDEVTEAMTVVDALVSPDLSILSVVLKSTVEGLVEYRIKTMDTNLLLARHEEIRLLAAKYVMVASAQMELQVIIQQMCEAWEDILREMDSRLNKFAEGKRKRQDPCSVGNDFLELLLFGTTSPELQTFLVDELTDKGLKKLGFSIENSYSKIQKLVVKELQRVSHNITSHLSDLSGMSQWYDRFAVLGLRPQILQEAVRTAGAFAISGSELQQVIDASMKNFKAFFRWLYIAIMRLSNEQLPTDLAKMTQHDINFVAEFLRDNFGDIEETDQSDSLTGSRGRDRPQTFRLEKVGQYLKSEDVTQPPNYLDNPWVQFLNASTFQKDSKVIYPNMQGKSLLQRKERLDASVGNAVLEPAKVIGASMSQVSCSCLFSIKESDTRVMQMPKILQFADPDSGILWCAYVTETFPCRFLHLMRHTSDDINNVQVAKLCIGTIGLPDQEVSHSPDRSPCSDHLVLDFDMFTSSTLTLLLQDGGDDEVCLLVQLPLGVVPEVAFIPMTLTRPQQSDLIIPPTDCGPMLAHASVTYQNNACGLAVAVGGVRTTAALLLKSQRRIRLFLLEDVDGDEEEEEDEEASRSNLIMSVSRGDMEETIEEEGGEDKENMA